jgi:hypothetical protein
MDEIYKAKSGASCINNKQTPCFVRRFVKKDAIESLNMPYLDQNRRNPAYNCHPWFFQLF